MRRALIWLNLYGREAFGHKIKNSQKNKKNAFLTCFKAYVGQPQCHLHQSILLSKVELAVLTINFAIWPTVSPLNSVCVVSKICCIVKMFCLAPKLSMILICTFFISFTRISKRKYTGLIRVRATDSETSFV